MVEFTPAQQAALDAADAATGAKGKFTPEQKAALQAADERIAGQEPEEEQEFGFIDAALGLGELGLVAGTGAFGEVVGGVGGIIEGTRTAIFEDEDPLEAADKRVKQLSEKFTFEPRTFGGKKTLEAVAPAFQAFGEFAQETGAGVQDISRDLGLPEGVGTGLAAATRSGIELAPGLLGAKVPTKGSRAARDDFRTLEGDFERVGIDPAADFPTQEAQIRAAAEGLVGGQTVRGEGLPTLKAGVERQRDLAKLEVDRLYDEARAKKAFLPVEVAVTFEPFALKALQESGVGPRQINRMPFVQDALNELTQIAELPPGSKVKLEALEQWRQTLNAMNPGKNDLPQGRALGILKGQYDNFIEAQFNADMILGSPDALAKWKGARAKRQEFGQVFEGDLQRAPRLKDTSAKTIRKLAEQEATPEEIRSWIFSVASVGGKPQASAVVKRLKNILGEDSPEFTALRQEAVFDIVEPLMREVPDVKAFVKKYDTLVKNNPSLVKELMPNSATQLAELRKIVPAPGNVITNKIRFAIDRTLSVGIFGHQMAKKAWLVRTATQAFRFIAGVSGKSRKRAVMAEILGYDAFSPMFSTRQAIGTVGAAQALEQETADIAEAKKAAEDAPIIEAEAAAIDKEQGR